jgi:hypothetical protein
MTEVSDFAFSEPGIIEAWQCIGCGRIEAPHPCIGGCQDRKVRFVDASFYEDAPARLCEAKREATALEGLAPRPVGAKLQELSRVGAAGTVGVFPSPVR